MRCSTRAMPRQGCARRLFQVELAFEGVVTDSNLRCIDQADVTPASEADGAASRLGDYGISRL